MTNPVPVATPAAPAAIGPYSQAMVIGNLVFLSGQIPLRPDGSLVSDDLTAEVNQIFDNLAAVAEAAGTSLSQTVRMTVFLTDLNDFNAVNEIMAGRLAEPYPARAAIGVAALPKNARVEVDAIIALPA